MRWITGTPDERRAALAAVPADGRQAALLGLIMASDPAEDKAATLAALDKVIADRLPATPAWRDLAVLRRVTGGGADLPLADRRAALEGHRRGRPPLSGAGGRTAGLSADRRRQDR
jgi:hypothetical protein